MKTYEEMAQSVISRAKVHKTVRHRWIIGSVAAALTLCFCLSATVLRPQNPALQETPVTGSPKAESRVTFLYATADDVTQMEQGVTLPCRSQLRVVDVTGKTDAEIEAIALAEQDYAEAMVVDYPEARGRGWMQYCASQPSRYNDHLVATYIHAGHFVLNVQDWSLVESIQASTKNSVLILPGLSGVHEVDPLAYPQSRQYYMGTEEMEQCNYEYYGGIGLDIGLGSGVVWYLNENPVPLSQLSETFTFTFNFTDGTQETYIIDMIFNDNGEIYTLYRGAEATV